MTGLFEALDLDTSMQRTASRRAVALANVRAQNQFGSFLGKGPDRRSRLAYIAQDLQRLVVEACKETGHNDPESVYYSVLSHLNVALPRVARRPKMCPYHRELTDISLTLGDPKSAFNTMASHAFGESSCRGSFNGACNWVPQMVTQDYWNQRQEESLQRAQDRAQQAPLSPPQTEENSQDWENEGGSSLSEEGYEGPDIDTALDAAPSAVGGPAEPVMAKKKKYPEGAVCSSCSNGTCSGCNGGNCGCGSCGGDGGGTTASVRQADDHSWEQEDMALPPGQMRVRAPDDPEGTLYNTDVPPEAKQAIHQFFGEPRPVVRHPEDPNTYIYDPGNFWDGPTHIKDNGDSTYSFDGYHGPETFGGAQPSEPESDTYDPFGQQDRHYQGTRKKNAFDDDEIWRPDSEHPHGSCPYCGSQDLDPFEDGTGSYCSDCFSNIYNDPNMEPSQPRQYKRPNFDLDEFADQLGNSLGMGFGGPQRSGAIPGAHDPNHFDPYADEEMGYDEDPYGEEGDPELLAALRLEYPQLSEEQLMQMAMMQGRQGPEMAPPIDPNAGWGNGYGDYGDIQGGPGQAYASIHEQIKADRRDRDDDSIEEHMDFPAQNGKGTATGLSTDSPVNIDRKTWEPSNMPKLEVDKPNGMHNTVEQDITQPTDYKGDAFNKDDGRFDSFKNPSKMEDLPSATGDGDDSGFAANNMSDPQSTGDTWTGDAWATNPVTKTPSSVIGSFLSTEEIDRAVRKFKG